MANTNDMLTVFHTNYNFILCYRTYLITGRYDPKVYTSNVSEKKGFCKGEGQLENVQEVEEDYIETAELCVDDSHKLGRW